MRSWAYNHLPWLIGLIFGGGIIYSQVLGNTSELDKREPDYQKIRILEMQVMANAKALNELATGSSAQYKEFLNKLDAVITRLDQRDEMQTETINSLMVDVHVLKAKIK